jgi:hypothetical protein
LDPLVPKQLTPVMTREYIKAWRMEKFIGKRKSLREVP